MTTRGCSLESGGGKWGALHGIAESSQEAGLGASCGRDGAGPLGIGARRPRPQGPALGRCSAAGEGGRGVGERKLRGPQQGRRRARATLRRLERAVSRATRSKLLNCLTTVQPQTSAPPDPERVGNRTSAPAAARGPLNPAVSAPK